MTHRLNRHHKASTFNDMLPRKQISINRSKMQAINATNNIHCYQSFLFSTPSYYITEITLSSASMLDVSVVVEDVSSLSASFSFSINFSLSRRISPAFSFLIFPCLALPMPPLLLAPNTTATETQSPSFSHYDTHHQKVENSINCCE